MLSMHVLKLLKKHTLFRPSFNAISIASSKAIISATRRRISFSGFEKFCQDLIPIVKSNDPAPIQLASFSTMLSQNILILSSISVHHYE